MNVRGFSSALLLLSLAGASRGATVVLTNSDAFGASSFNAALNWSDGLAPAPGNDYLVTNAFTLRTPAVAGDQAFAGDALALGDGTTPGTLTYKGIGGIDVITVGNLTLNRGLVGNGQGGNFFLAGALTLGDGGGAFDYGGGGRTITVQSPIGGGGGLLVTNVGTGAGTVILAADNTYAGPTTIATGTLQVGIGGTAGTLGGGAVTNRGTLVFNRADNLLVTNAISGETGALLVRNGGVTLLDNGVTNLSLQVPDTAGAVANVVLNLSNSTVHVLANALGNCNVGGVGNASASGTVNMNGGSLTVANELWLAAGAGNSRGYFNLYSGNVLVSNWTAIGRGNPNNSTGSYGELNLFGGSWSNVALNNLSLASFAGNEGRVQVAGGRLYAQNAIFVGESGTGLLTVAAGGVVDVNAVTIGDRNTGAGTVIVSGGVLRARTSVSVANAAATAGSLYLSGGELRANTLQTVGAANLVWLSGGTIGPYSADLSSTAAIFLGADPVNGGAGIVTADVQTVTGGGAKMVVSGAVSGDGALVKAGAGELLIASASSYAGGTTVKRGHLSGTGSVASAVTVNDGGLIGPASLTQIGTFTVAGDVTLDGGAGVGAFLNGATPSLIVGGTLTCNATNPLKLLALPGGVSTGTHTLVGYGTLSGFAFTTGSLPAGVQGYVQDNPMAQTIEFVVTSPSDSLRWTGASNGVWDIETTTNWNLVAGAVPATYQNGLPVFFDDTGANPALTLAAPATPDGLIVSNETVAYSFGGASIDGPAGITKQGAADLTISNAAAYTGTNRVLGGTLRAASATALGSTAGPTLVEGGTLDVGGQNLGQERLEIAGAGVGGEGAIVNKGATQLNALQYVTLQANATIGGSNRWDIRAGAAPYLNLNSFALTKTGSNYIGLVNVAVTNAGDIAIDLGTLAAHVGTVVSGPGTLTVNPNGIFAPGTFGTPANVTKSVTLNGGILRLEATGGAPLTLPAAITLNAGVTNIIDAPDQIFTLTGAVAGPGGLTKTGANVLVLGETNTYAGATVVTAGQLHLGSATIANGTFGGGTVSNSVPVVFNRPDAHTVTNTILGTGSLIARRGTTTLQDTVVTNVALTVLDGAAPGATLNIANTRLWLNNAANNQCQIGALPNTPTATGIVNMSSGFLRSGNEIWIAAGTNLSRGIFNLTGGDVSVASWTAVGRGNAANQAAYGELNISGGTWSNIAANNVTLGSFANNTGRLSVTAGRLYAQNNLYVAEGGVAFASVGGTGVVDVNILNVAVNANGRGRIDLAGGTVQVRNALILGNNAGTIGTLYQTAGALSTAAGDGKLANNATAYGYLRMDGGTFTTVNNFQIGATGTGIMELDGTAAYTANASFPVAGRSVGGRGVLRVTGGSFTHNSSGTFLIIGEQGGGVLSVGGSGTVTVHAARTADGLRLSHNLGTGLVAVATGGTIVAPAVSRGTGTNGVFVFDGGTLRANTNNAAFMQTLSAVHVQSGGARIDDGGFAITIAQPLITAPGSGLVSIPVVTTGDGYKGAPLVQIASGGGINAAAIAQLDPIAGGVTNIVVVSQGSGYTSLPAITLVGAAPVTPATLGTPVLATNVSGGLTKLGAGTLTLTASNSYAGPTIVSNGTLALSGAGSFDNSTSITVAAGATLSVTALANPTLAVGPTRSLYGAGTVAGSVYNDGAVNPGPTTGVLTVTGDYAQTNGTLNIEIGGPALGTDYDQLNVVGASTLGGTLNVTFINGYTGNVGDAFLVLSVGGVNSGAFATTNLPPLGPNRGWEALAMGGSLLLSITGGTPVAGYDVFAAQIPNPADRGYQNDPDNDGYANLLEYATGGDPTNTDTVARMNSGRTNGVLALKFNRATNALDTTIYVEGSYTATNDADWASVAIHSNSLWSGAGAVTEAGGPNPVNVTVEDTQPAATNRFLRLRVTRP